MSLIRIALVVLNWGRGFVHGSFRTLDALYSPRIALIYGSKLWAWSRSLSRHDSRDSAEEPRKLGRKAGIMEKRYYNAASLEQSLKAFEGRFAMDSETFIRAHEIDAESVRPIPRFVRHTWASFYLDWERLSGDDFGRAVARDLELV